MIVRTTYMLLTLQLTTDLTMLNMSLPGTNVMPCRIGCQCNYKRTRQTTPCNRLHSATKTRLAYDLCVQLEQLFSKVSTYVGAPP